MTHKLLVEDLKTRLDKFLAEKLAGVSRSQIQKDIESGLVYVNGKNQAVSKFVVRKGDEVEYRLPVRSEGAGLKAANVPLKILYNSQGLIIIDKPAGLAVHPGAGFKGETLASALLYHFKGIHTVGEEHRPGIVHRLDKDTSGVILVAANQDMYEYLKDAFAERKIKKQYIALVSGRLEKPYGFIDAPIGKSKSDFRKQATDDPQDPKEALTEYKILEHLPRENSAAPLGEAGKTGNDRNQGVLDQYTLVLVKLHTGRTHQIRVHFKSIGHPLMGDELYGNKKTRLAGLNRQFLHAGKIEVRLPDGTWIEAESELAADLKKVLAGLNSKEMRNL